MTTQSILLSDDIRTYISAHTVRENSVQESLRSTTSTLAEAHYQIAPEEGALLAFLVTSLRADRIVEIGTFTGYSALTMALAQSPNGRIITLDISDEFTRFGRAAWAESGVDHKIDLRLADGPDSMTRIQADPDWMGRTDLVFIDADKERYDTYYEQALPLLRPGGVVAIDNVLWRGRVVDPTNVKEKTLAMRALNQKIHADQRVVPVILPVGDGVTLAAKKA